MSQLAVAIGNFDGVHRGHQRVFAEALRDGAQLTVLTFWPHPVSLLRPEKAPTLLCSLERRIELLQAAGADEVRVIQFTPEVAALDAESFVDRFVAPLSPRRVVVGENFRFGRGARSDVADLARIGASRGFEVTPVPMASLEETTTSSSHIRRSVQAGLVEEAALHLGRPFCVSGVVVVGDQRGRGLGFPTANLIVDQSMAIPSDGVYAGWLRVGSDRLPAAISVGTNPTFDGVERRIESYVLDRDDLELYGLRVTVEFTSQLRGQVRFSGVEDLIAQMHQDVAACRALLGTISG